MSSRLEARVVRLEGHRPAEPFPYLDDGQARVILDAVGRPDAATVPRPRLALDRLVHEDRPTRLRLMEALTMLVAPAPEASPC